MCDRKNQIEDAIAKVKKELAYLIELRETISGLILETSQELDYLIVEYMKEKGGR